MIYEHTQIGRLMIFILLITVFYFVFIFNKIGPDSTFFITMFFILFVILSFVSLKVVIDEEYLRIKFGYGIFKKRFILKKIVSARVVKNHWYYGWGIRHRLIPPMWIYNVSGFDAVEIKMEDGKTHRIGTDEPGNLEQAVTQAIRQSM